MTDDLYYEVKRLRALEKFLRQDLEERTTYFMHDREQLEKRVYELQTERDWLARNIAGVTGARALAIALIAYDDVRRGWKPWEARKMDRDLDLAWTNCLELARQIIDDLDEKQLVKTRAVTQ